MSGAAVKKEEEEKKKKPEPAPFSQMAPAQAEDEKKKKMAPEFRPASDVFGDELMTSAPTMEQQARISHEAGVRKELEGLKRAKERKRRRQGQKEGGKVKQEGN